MSTFLNIVNGQLRQLTAIQTSSGTADANKLVATGSDGRLSTTLMPVGVGPETHSATAGEALAAGNLVYISSTGTVLKADASAANASKAAIGFVLSAVSNGGTAVVYTDAYLTGLSGLTPGSRQYLSASTAGAITATPPSTSGHCVQCVGLALSATVLWFHPQDPVILA